MEGYIVSFPVNLITELQFITLPSYNVIATCSDDLHVLEAGLYL